jgi:RND family efflux transporter MFP subunit
MKSINWKTTLLLTSLALPAALLLAGCNAKAQQAAAQPPPPSVTVAPVQQQEITEWDELVGRTEALETVEVRPRVSGHLAEVNFQAGAHVKKGDLLFVIDKRWHQAEFDRAHAEFERAKVRLAIAEREAKRSAQLLDSKAISTEEADAREARAAEAKAGLLSAEAAASTAKLELEFCEVRAPIEGKISRALVTPGNHVSGVPGFTTVLATIVTMDPIYVYSDVDEATLLKFNSLLREKKLGEDGKVPVLMDTSDAGDFKFKGEIDSFDNRVDAGTGSILLRTVFPNPTGELIPGLFVRVRLPGSARYNAVTIDETAIGTDQNRKFVLTLSSTNTVEYRPVTLGPSLQGKRIVRAGLQPGETIVVNGIQRVRPGMPVSPEFAKPAHGVQTARN